MVQQQLLDILVCPMGKSDLRQEGDLLVCVKCGPRFRITREGYPNMLIEDAELPVDCKGVDDLRCVKEGGGSGATAKSS